jgi:4-alpha-glucanotransferase
MTSLKKHLQNSPSAEHWEKIGIRSHAGINLPLSALKSATSCGIGEFLDLIPLIKWCSELGLSVIQLLPLNDSGADPSPYNALSSCALHPIYLSLTKLPHLKNQEIITKIEEMQGLNTASRVPFDTVLTRKMHILSLYFKEHGEEILASSGFQNFIKSHSWLKPYALFKTLLHENSHAPLASWPDDLKYVSSKSFETLLVAHEESVSFHLAMQYLCFVQLKEVKDIANASGVLLKGDLPILISPNSSDVWHHPEFFNLDLQVGAPPDEYCEEGQNWGFPGFHWTDIKKTKFIWWKERLAYASYFYDLYRIDHAIGFFRLWTIPKGAANDCGYFCPADETLWGPHGKEILDVLLEASLMLPIAEDLGLIPPVVRPILKELGIPGTKVMRWEKDWNKNHSLIDPKKYEPISLTCVSTHDSPTLEQWWRDFPEESVPYAEEKNWNYNSNITYEQRVTILKESLSSASLFHINLFGEYLALVPGFVDPNPDYERINIPGTVQPSNWTYKFQKPIEEIVSCPLLKQEMEKILP